MKVVRTMYTISKGQPIAGILKHVYKTSTASVRSNRNNTPVELILVKIPQVMLLRLFSTKSLSHQLKGTP